jgi:two-component system cell cycle response regulator
MPPHPPTDEEALAREERRRGSIGALLDLTRRLTEDGALEELLRCVTDCALALTGGDHASIRLIDPSRNVLLAGARSGSATDARPMTFRRGEGLIGWAIEHGQSLNVPDVSADPRFAVFSGQGFAVRSVVVEPMLAHGDVIGALSASSPEPNAFDEEDQLLVRLLANCSVSPIERARLRRLALYDDLTMAFNHRYLALRLQEELDRAQQARRASSIAGPAGTVSLLLFDLDHFKRVNDLHGHQVGDRVLRIFADRVRASVRQADILVRRGGEEFVLIMPQTGEEAAVATAERIRAALGDSAIVPSAGIELRQTVSIGVACWDGAESAEELEARADAAMYVAKGAGRNLVRSSLPPPPR